MAEFAEMNGPLLIGEVMQHILHANEIAVPQGGDCGSPNTCGLYMFSLRDNNNIDYPVYVGYTGRSFRRRFREHGNNGVINGFYTGVFPQPNVPNLHLFVYTFSGDFAAAKLLESIFLRSFDFARNIEENNNQTRANLHIAPPVNPPGDSKHYLRDGYHAIMLDVKGIQDSFSDLLGPVFLNEISVSGKKPSAKPEVKPADKKPSAKPEVKQADKKPSGKPSEKPKKEMKKEVKPTEKKSEKKPKS